MELSFFDCIPRQFRAQVMCENAIEGNIFFDAIPDEYKTQEMCATRPTLFFEDAPDYFVTPKMLELCEYPTAQKEVEEEVKEWVN